MRHSTLRVHFQQIKNLVFDHKDNIESLVFVEEDTGNTVQLDRPVFNYFHPTDKTFHFSAPTAGAHAVKTTVIPWRNILEINVAD